MMARSQAGRRSGKNRQVEAARKVERLLDLACEDFAIEHQNEMDRNHADALNFGWVQERDEDDACLISKTDKGRLKSTLDFKTGEIEHEWIEY